MAIIKSAWELALEKTATLEADPVKIRRDLKIKEGRQIAATFLMDIDVNKEDTQAKYDAFPEEEKQTIREGMALTLLSNLALPRTPLFKEAFPNLLALGTIIAEGDEQITSLVSQVEGFFSQYLQNQEDLITRMKEQFGPHLEQKQAQMRQQYGPNFVLRPEQDPEFMKLLDKNLAQLDEQYNAILDQAKDQLKELLKIA
ncbi:MAG: hypothetical protein RBR15_12960 [Sphaerochaeta sp.]|nr:hypothetical protein [Sphaerochaeta sp.]